MAWGPTLATNDQYLYYTGLDMLHEGLRGIYLNTLGNASGGTKLVSIEPLNGTGVHDIEWLPDGSGFLCTMRYVPLDIYSDIFEYKFATQEITRLTPSLLDESGDGGSRGLSLSPDGQQIVFERALYPFDTQNSVWMMNRNGTGLHKLADDAGSPSWGPVPPPPAAVLYIPMVVRKQ